MQDPNKNARKHRCELGDNPHDAELDDEACRPDRAGGNDAPAEKTTRENHRKLRPRIPEERSAVRQRSPDADKGNNDPCSCEDESRPAGEIEERRDAAVSDREAIQPKAGEMVIAESDDGTGRRDGKEHAWVEQHPLDADQFTE